MKKSDLFNIIFLLHAEAGSGFVEGTLVKRGKVIEAIEILWLRWQTIDFPLFTWPTLALLFFLLVLLHTLPSFFPHPLPNPSCYSSSFPLSCFCSSWFFFSFPSSSSFLSFFCFFFFFLFRFIFLLAFSYSPDTYKYSRHHNLISLNHYLLAITCND